MWTVPRQSHCMASMTRLLRRLLASVAGEAEVVAETTPLLEEEEEVVVELADLRQDMEPLVNKEMIETFTYVVMKDTERGGIKL